MYILGVDNLGCIYIPKNNRGEIHDCFCLGQMLDIIDLFVCYNVLTTNKEELL